MTDKNGLIDRLPCDERAHNSARKAIARSIGVHDQISADLIDRERLDLGCVVCVLLRGVDDDGGLSAVCDDCCTCAGEVGLRDECECDGDCFEVVGLWKTV